ncbi:MAG: hypothetical protein PHP74_05075 [Candidatus Gracilibacteria bacterium]|nr:hypothetical protein [Candidatus Gracilibacteria bacterium]
MPPKKVSTEKPKNATKIIRTLYLYMVTGISIVMILISATMGVNLILKEYVFKVLDYEQVEGPWECQDDQLFMIYDEKGNQISKTPSLTEDQKKLKKDECMKKAEERINKRHKNDINRDLAQMMSMFLVAVPFYLYHWGVIKKDHSKE